MPSSLPQSASLLMRLGSLVLIVTTLSLGRDLLIPLTLAGLLSFVLAPVVSWLERWGLPRVPSVIVVAVLAFSVVGGLGTLVTTQVLELTESLPEYRQTIKQRLRDVRSSGGGVIDKATEMVKEVRQEVEDETEKTAEEQRGTDPEPVPVRIEPGPQTPVEVISSYLGPVLGSLGKAAIVVIFVIFILIYRTDLRDRVIRLMGLGRLHLTTKTLDEAGDRISRYLLMQLLINTLYGVPVGLGLWLLGLPGALLWGMMAIALRFIPYLGPWLAACLPIALSLAVFEGWTGPLAVAGLFVVMELISNNVMEPWLYGSSTGLSPLAILASAAFWSWLWGPVGLMLAVPMTACLVVVGRRVPQLEFIAVLLGDEPALDPASRFYQRVLAGDDEEAMEIAEAHRKEHGLTATYDQVVTPALYLGERDRHRGHMDRDEQRVVHDCVRELIEELGEAKDPEVEGPGVGTPLNGLVLCVPGRDEADDLTTRMLAQLLEAQGVRVEVAASAGMAGETLDRIEASGASLVCLSDLPPTVVAHTRYTCKMIRRRLPQIPLVVGLWRWGGDLEKAQTRLKTVGADHVVTSFKTAVERIRTSLTQKQNVEAHENNNEAPPVNRGLSIVIPRVDPRLSDSGRSVE